MTPSSLLMLSWATCGDDDHWCNFLRLKLDSNSLSKGGVYVIWSEDADGSRKAAIYVGQGKPVAECLARHKDEATITQHERNGRVLRATWAKVRKEERGGQNATSQIPCDRLRVTVGPATALFPSTFLGEGKTRQQTQPVCGLCWEGPGGCLASSQPTPRGRSVSLSFARWAVFTYTSRAARVLGSERASSGFPPDVRQAARVIAVMLPSIEL